MKNKMRELIDYLNARTKEYDEGNPTIYDKEWDDKYFELVRLEKENNFAFPDSPTQTVIYAVVNSLNKIQHNHPMLSLEKTKNIDVIKTFIGNNNLIAMCKMDGLTCSLRYLNGSLVSAETRGNGYEGEDVTHNAMVIPSIPKIIPYKEELIIDGEIICTYKDFEEFKDEYKNPRNFASGSIRLLDSKECEKRKLTFVAWDIIKGLSQFKTLSEKLDEIRRKEFGFYIASYIALKPNHFKECSDHIISILKQNAEHHSYPIDGLVFKFDDIEYGKSKGQTSHHFNNAMAFKFYDELYPTRLKKIEWTMGRTGVLTPVAIFRPIEIDGTTVERANLHNVEVLKDTLGTPYEGQYIEVYKSNEIIPQIDSAEKENVFSLPELTIPSECPICGGATELIKSENTTVLMCANPNCEGKFINKLTHFCGKKGLDIKGLSSATLEKLIDFGWVNSIKDIFSLSDHRKEWIKKSGFGVSSVDKVLTGIEEAKNTTLPQFISSIGIPNIGNNIARQLADHFLTYENFRKAIDEKFNFSVLDGFAENKTNVLLTFDYTEADEIYKLLNISNVTPKVKVSSNKKFNAVITGRMTTFANRQELKEFIEEHGGKLMGAVSSTTNYLIINDINSTSTKARKAKELGIELITEEDFIKLF